VARAKEVLLEVDYIANEQWEDPSPYCGFYAESTDDELFLETLNETPYWADYYQYSSGTQ